ncbi:MAG: CAP domain-containing protein, partial [Clostridia bacterium]|nr:CAP domain-containing protein [Clostridia bacterium]
QPTVFNCGELPGSYEPTEFEMQFFDAINAEREKEGLPALKWNDAAHTMASVRAKEIIDVWSHTRPDGRNKSSVLDDFGLESIPMGENLAKGGAQNSETVAKMVDSLMNSEGHRANILNPDVTYTGVAAAFDENGKAYVCQLFL